ncbi:MAG: hypothetical protein NXH91_06695 [Phyllobacteriaceae bacterium]|jgi:hypothetical protein|nr:hypothetical protein [Phyllobacteriaceae bacterium]
MRMAAFCGVFLVLLLRNALAQEEAIVPPPMPEPSVEVAFANWAELMSQPNEAFDGLVEFRQEANEARRQLRRAINRTLGREPSLDELCAVSEIVVESFVYSLVPEKFDWDYGGWDFDAETGEQFVARVVETGKMAESLLDAGVPRCRGRRLDYNWYKAHLQLSVFLAERLPQEDVLRLWQLNGLLREAGQSLTPYWLNTRAWGGLQSLDRCADPGPAVATRLDEIHELMAALPPEIFQDDLPAYRFTEADAQLFDRIKLAATYFVPARVSTGRLGNAFSQADHIWFDCVAPDRHFPSLREGTVLEFDDSVFTFGIDLSRQTVKAIWIDDVAFRGEIDLHRSAFDDMVMRNLRGVPMTIDPFADPYEWGYRWSEVPPKIDAYSLRVSNDIMLDGVAGVRNFNFYGSNLGNDARFHDISGVGNFDLANTTGRFLWLRDVSALDGDDDAEPRLSLRDGRSWSRISLENIDGFDLVEAVQLAARSLYIYNAENIGRVRLYQAESNYLRMERSDLRRIDLALGQFNTLVMDRVAVDRIDAQNVEIPRAAYFWGMVMAGRDRPASDDEDRPGLIDFSAADVDEISMNNVCARTAEIDFSSARIGQVAGFNSVDVGVLNMDTVSAQGVHYFGRVPVRPAEPDISEENPSPAAVIDGEADDAQHAENADEPVAAADDVQAETRPWEDCEASTRIGTMTMIGAHVAELRLSGGFEDKLFLNGLQSDRILFQDGRVRFDRRSKVFMRDVNVGTISAPRLGFRSDDAAVPVDVMGARFNILKWYEPGRDLPPGEDDAAVDAADGGDGDCAFFDCLLASFSAGSGGGYDPFVYTALRDSASALGMNAEARSLAIAKNDAYRESLTTDSWDGWGIWAIYSLGKYINAYGYNNLLGFIWLIGLWIFGVIVLLWPGTAQTQDGEDNASVVLNLPSYRAFFASLDRTIPALGLDEAFTHTRTLHPARAMLIYLQRFVAFIVVAIILGGLFDFFQ